MAEEPVYTTSHPRPVEDGAPTIRVDPDAPRHATAPPSGSSHAAVETPRTGRSRRWLWIALAAVVAILIIFLLLPGGEDGVEGAAIEGAQTEVVTTGADPVEDTGGTVVVPAD